jgi:tetratricopeptide (TPR) repeat protein
LVKKTRTKPPARRKTFWTVFLFAAVAFSAAWGIWYCLYCILPQFNFLLIKKNGQPLKLLKGEVLHLHPRDRLRITEISTNLCFNLGVRLVARGFDANALLYEEMVMVELLPDREIFDSYRFSIMVKQYNHNLGCVDLSVEPDVEDWLEKAARSIHGDQRVAILERALKILPEETRIRDSLIDEYKSLKRWQQAALVLEELAKQDPDQKVLYDLLEVYEAMPKMDKIISVLRRLVDRNPDDLELRLQLASVLEDAKRPKKAIKAYEGLLKRMRKEDRLPVYKTLGYLYTEIGQIRKAISSYLNAVELDKKDVNLYYNLSTLYERIGQKNKADFYLKGAVNLKSEDTENRIRLAERLIKKGERGEAEKYLKEALKKSPDSVEALLLMIQITENKGDKENLKKYYRSLLSLDPKNETIIYNLGVLEYETGDLAKSLPYFEKLAKINPKDAAVRGLLFDVYRKQKKHALAFKEAGQLIELRPQQLDPYLYVFEYLNGRNEYDEMIGFITKGLKHQPKNIELREYLIIAYLKTGKEDLAIEQIKEILRFKPDDIALLLQLAKLQEKQGKFSEAMKTFKKIVDISPGHEEAGEAYLRLRLEVLPGEGDTY